jgi:thioredoxin reductase (NADPH)
MKETYEVVIIGAGPAAFSAATFLARANVKTLVIGDPAQSGLMDAAEVWNYPGFPAGISGRMLLESMHDGAVKQGATFLQGEVTHVEKLTPGFKVKTADTKEFFATNILLAHGANFIKVNLPGEQERVGKGVHYCALCDGPLYKGKEVVVLGNGNLAAEEALQLAGMGAVVKKIISQARATHISNEYLAALTGKNIPVEIGRVETLATAEVFFVALGVASSATFAQKLGLEMQGNFLKADEQGRTGVAGVWVAGLARGGVNQVAKSVGEGAAVAVAIIKEVKGLPQYLDHT